MPPGRTRPRRPCPPPASRLSRGRGQLRPVVSIHARACRRAPVRRCFARSSSSCPATGWRWSTRSAGCRTRLHQRLDQEVHLPGRLHPGCRRCCPRSSAAGSGSPTSRSCACTTPTRCASGASVRGQLGPAAALYDERFCRMWEYYLATSEVSFRYLDNMNFQIQLAPDRNTLPLARYMIEEEPAPALPRLLERAAGWRRRRAGGAVARGQRHRTARHGRRPPNGKLVVLLHGFPEFWYGWRSARPLGRGGPARGRPRLARLQPVYQARGHFRLPAGRPGRRRPGLGRCPGPPPVRHRRP